MPERPPLTLAELAGYPVERVAGAGARAGAFRSLGVATVLDLLTFYPRRWIDRSHQASVRELREGDQALVIGEVAAVRSVPSSRGARGKARVEATVTDPSGRISLTFFNQPWRAQQLRPGAFVAVFGKVTSFRGARQMANPTVDVLGDPDERPRPVVPVYPQSEKVRLGSRDIGRAVEVALQRTRPRGIDDPVPATVLHRLGLVTRDRALWGIHLPETLAERDAARRRLAFDELLRIQLVLVLRKVQLERDAEAISHVVGGPLVARFHEHLPFRLTDAQRRVIAEIEADLASPRPMHRLLQGDVGAGKTVVAVSALLAAVQGGHQGALMAPTEVLAEQHAAGVRRLLDGLEVGDDASLFGGRPLRVALLTNRVTGAERRAVLDGLADGAVDLVVGTHALIQDRVAFRSLGVVVIDEQHRFGVEQRAALREKTGPGQATVPDVLVMTATPIPRTAAMTVYGDLDVSVLDQAPAGRTPVRTRWAAGPLLEAEVWAHVREEAAAGHQAYVVCPLVEESEKLEVASAEETYQRLAHDELRGLRLGLLHGRVAPAEKEAVMDRFRRGELDVLVATTVIEVGVDVANATAMVVLDADRFGIAQLHQLRGRVGRGTAASTCWLVTAPPEDGAGMPARVEALVGTTDGFELAEIDLELRGEGTIMSTAQKGVSDLKLASLRRDKELVVQARQAAFAVVADDPDLDAHPRLREELALFLSDEDEAYLFKS